MMWDKKLSSNLLSSRKYLVVLLETYLTVWAKGP